MFARRSGIASGAAALIDGLYIRCALEGFPGDAREAISLVEDYIDTQLSNAG